MAGTDPAEAHRARSSRRRPDFALTSGLWAAQKACVIPPALRSCMRPRHATKTGACRRATTASVSPSGATPSLRPGVLVRAIADLSRRVHWLVQRSLTTPGTAHSASACTRPDDGELRTAAEHGLLLPTQTSASALAPGPRSAPLRRRARRGRRVSCAWRASRVDSTSEPGTSSPSLLDRLARRTPRRPAATPPALPPASLRDAGKTLPSACHPRPLAPSIWIQGAEEWADVS